MDYELQAASHRRHARYHTTRARLMSSEQRAGRDLVPALNFLKTLRANVDNEKLSNDQFRLFVRNTLPIVEGAED